MSGRSPYTNGYGYPSDSGRSDGGGAYGGGGSLGVNGYGGSGGRERERRPGGYGGFYSEESQQRPTTASSTASRERGRDRPNWERPPQSSASRSRPRDVDTGTRWRPDRDELDYTKPRGRSDTNGSRGPQSIEGMVLPCQYRDYGSMAVFRYFADSAILQMSSRRFSVDGISWQRTTAHQSRWRCS